MSLSNYEPEPTKGHDVVVDLVVKDLQERKEFGLKKYGTPLMTFNGRNTLIDVYQEAMDLIIYMRQLIAENEDLAYIWDNRQLIADNPGLAFEIKTLIKRYIE